MLWKMLLAINLANQKRFKDLKMKKYHLKLQEDLIINLADRPHIAVWGKR
jgi:hypothetical protein